MKVSLSRSLFSVACLAAGSLVSASSGATGQPGNAAGMRQPDLVQRTALSDNRLPPGLVSAQGITAPDEGVAADMAQISTLLQQGKTDQALKAIDALQKKRPGDVVPSFLRGRALLQKGDAAGARKALEQALQIDANYFPAVAVLAGLDNAERHPDAARVRLEAAIQRQPGNVLAYQVLAELRAASGADKAEIIGILRRAVDAAPNSPQAHHLLVEYFLRSGEPKEALAAAQKAVRSLT